MTSQSLSIITSQDKISLTSIVVSFLTILTTLIYFQVSRDQLPSYLPLLYSNRWGEPYLVSQLQFLLLPFISLLITLINLIISWHLHTSQLVLKRILSLTSLTLSILLCTTAIKIINIFI